jgi:hypothetical protein
MAKHLRLPSTRQRVTRALVVPVAAVAALAATAPAFAAKGTGGPAATGGSTSASCSASPNPVTQNTDYTLTVNGLAASQIVNVLVSDSGGTTVWQLQADDTGSTAVVGHAWWSGTSNVKVQKQSKHSWTVLATCSFSVV